MEPVVVIAGPTASGKTSLSVELAKRINGSIVSADSMQIYKYMDIGTAKPTEQEMSGIRHYMMDEVEPDENYSVARYKERALECISAVIKDGRRPIVTGGTGLYINSLIYNINFSETICDESLRESLKTEAEQHGSRHLYEKLLEIDPEAASRIHENDTKRIIRAIEVYTHTRKTISEHIRTSRIEPPHYKYIVFGLKWDREILYRRINERVDKMIREGLVDETRRLVEMGFDRGTAMQAIGYKEILPFLKGECSLDEAVETLKRNTRRYAKRQMTWFRRIREITWLDMGEDTDLQDTAEKIIHHCIERFGIIL